MSYLKIWAWCSVIGLVAGAMSATYLAGLGTLRNPLGEQVFLNNWASNWTIGTKASDPYTTAWVARYGLLALRRSEAVYFIANRDENGDRLEERCSYWLTGGKLPAKWWSFTVYDSEGFLPLNEDHHLSFDATDVRDPTRWKVFISPEPPAPVRARGDNAQAARPPAWISTNGAGRFDVTMRLYLPDPAFIEKPHAHISPPIIRKIRCAEAT